MNLKELRSRHKLINLFVELCQVPSPPLKEAAVAQKIMKVFNQHRVQAEYDDFGNVIARIPGTRKYKDIQPVLLSAHMDVVGGSEEVNTGLSGDGKYIETDKTRTLGADNKAGVAAIMDLAIELAGPENKLEHGPVEITFTRDEEKGMNGIRRLDTSRLHSKYAIIADGENLGELDCEGASFTNVFIKIHGGKGGHSGINIHETDRVSAIKVLAELEANVPQGVYKSDPQRGTITSINAGLCMGGSTGIYVSEMIKSAYELAKQGKTLPNEYSSANLPDTVSRHAMLNIIATEACISYSIRSSEPQNEQELIEFIKNEAKTLNEKYNNAIKVDVDVVYHLLPFVRNEDDFLARVIIKAGEKSGMNCVPSTFHAGAETHILANEKQNADGEVFNPVIIGLADLQNIHSADEKIDWQSFLQGRKWLEQIVVQFAEDLAGNRR